MSQNMSRTRELEAVAFDVLLFTKVSPLLDSVKKKTTEWSKIVKERGRGHGQGPPHLRAWVGLCEGLLETGLEIGMTNREQLTKYHQQYKDMPPEEQALAVRYCRSKPGFEKGHMKLIVALRGSLEDMRPHLVSALAQAGGELKTGRAPRSGVDRAFQNFLDNLEVEEE